MTLDEAQQKAWQMGRNSVVKTCAFSAGEAILTRLDQLANEHNESRSGMITAALVMLFDALESK